MILHQLLKLRRLQSGYNLRIISKETGIPIKIIELFEHGNMDNMKLFIYYLEKFLNYDDIVNIKENGVLRYEP